MIEFVDVNKNNWKEAVMLAVEPHQEEFVGKSAEAIVEAIYTGRKIRLIQRVADERIVGFLTTRRDVDCVHLCRFMIDCKYQRQGYGEAALLKLIHETEANSYMKSIMLLVSPYNIPAMALYKKMGFEDLAQSNMTSNRVWMYSISKRRPKRDRE
jgi:diamine N-acetyltransferase